MIVVVSYSIAAFAQDKAPFGCPTIEVEGPEGVWIANYGRDITFSAKVSNYRGAALNYQWSVSRGTIVGG